MWLVQHRTAAIRAGEWLDFYEAKKGLVFSQTIDALYHRRERKKRSATVIIMANEYEGTFRLEIFFFFMVIVGEIR